MNYGKFFRLNQNISKIDEGVAIFDYIDLPAYFDSSESNKMSPKYPISVTVTGNSVRFRVHYNVFKNEDANSSVRYLYDVKKAYDEHHHGLTQLKHKEQVILELPYNNDSVDKLHQVIKEIYNTKYPFYDGKQTLIYELIQKRYGVEANYINDLEKELYTKLQKCLDGDFSYSTLWLMDIIENDCDGNKFVSLYGKKQQSNFVVKFLRKLLLDFMFDLKHSDVFQTSKYYESMYSGLMSNFYFSALMHKCEYYFYRGLVTDVIKKKISDEETRKRHICKLYAKELFEAEDLWMHDIMSPSAEKMFDHIYMKEEAELNEIASKNNNIWKEFINEFKEERGRYAFRNWDSWFASPEEEMRRICFTMNEDKGSIAHICNAETISEYLKDSPVKLKKKLEQKKDSNKAEVSQWFLKRYAFNDVFHLHLFKYANWLFFMSISIILLLLFLLPSFVSPSFWTTYYYAPIYGAFILVFLFCVWGKEMFEEYKKQAETANELVLVRSKLVWHRIKAVTLTFIWALIIISTINRWMNSVCPWMNEESPRGTLIKISVILSQAALILGGGWIIYKKVYPVHWLSNMHVFFPRLIASIAAAWLTLAVGNELFGTFFDSIISWSTSIWLTIIVFIFVMYEINKLLPLETTLNKVLRCMGIITISYVVSLITGLFIINFTGERFLERSGVLEDFYENVVNDKNGKQIENKHYFIRSEQNLPKMTKDQQRLEGLTHIHIIPSNESYIMKDDHPIATTWPLSGGAYFFILRDFLIQFAFVAMFIGIFIQMLFEEKSITEI